MSTLEDMDPMQEVPFSSLDLKDPFFGSLRESYADFGCWFKKKSLAGERTWVVRDVNGGRLIAMLYLKKEDGVEPGVVPELSGPRMKIGTFKVNLDHHTSLGKRLLAVALREFAQSGLPRIYVTMHDNDDTKGLRKLLRQYGFDHIGMKDDEEVWEKRGPPWGNVIRTDPFPSYHRPIKGITSSPSIPNTIIGCSWNDSGPRRTCPSRMRSARTRWRSFTCQRPPTLPPFGPETASRSIEPALRDVRRNSPRS